ncbi:hypothetical protein EDC02_5920 [Micromonospora sp. Llam0]|nr:hypothetical protein EDC02_5920 [Micromonospora sp. Llam0]
MSTNQPTGKVPHNRGCGELLIAAMTAIAAVVTVLWGAR